MTAVFSPAKSASLPEICAPHQVLPSGALLAATGVTATAIGSYLAEWVIKHWGYEACLQIDALTFLVSAAAVAWIAFPNRERRPVSSFAQTSRDLKEGFRAIWNNPELIQICSFLFLFWFAAANVKIISVNFAKERLGVGESMEGVGGILAVAGIGLLLGAAATAVFGHRIVRRAAYLFASAGMGAALFAMAGTHTMGWALTWLFLAGVAGGTLVSRIDADILKVIDPGVRGRVFGATSVLFAAAMISPILSGGFLARCLPAASVVYMLATLLMGLGAIVGVRLLKDLKAGKPLILPP
jgi:MFS family permease